MAYKAKDNKAVRVNLLNNKINNIPDSPIGTAFVQRNGTRFVRAGKKFKYIGVNFYSLINNNPAWTQAQLNSFFQSCVNDGIKVVRTWAFNNVTPAVNQDGVFRYLNGAALSWRENTFVQMDKVLATAATYGVLLSLVLVDNYGDSGGGSNKGDYCNWNNAINGTTLPNSPGDDFHTVPTIQQFFKDFLLKLANRTNTVNGRTYKNDDTIFSWELGNELRYTLGTDSNPTTTSSSHLTTLTTWYDTMSTYLKSIDSNHLVGTGSQAQFYDYYLNDPFHNSTYYGGDYNIQHSLANIDYYDFHFYPTNDYPTFGLKAIGQKATSNPSTTPTAAGLVAQIKEYVSLAKAGNKPVVCGEWGLDKRNTLDDVYPTYPRWKHYQKVMNDFFDAGGDGFLLWHYTNLFDDPNYNINPTGPHTGANAAGNANDDDSLLRSLISGGGSGGAGATVNITNTAPSVYNSLKLNNSAAQPNVDATAGQFYIDLIDKTPRYMDASGNTFKWTLTPTGAIPTSPPGGTGSGTPPTTPPGGTPPPPSSVYQPGLTTLTSNCADFSAFNAASPVTAGGESVVVVSNVGSDGSPGYKWSVNQNVYTEVAVNKDLSGTKTRNLIFDFKLDNAASLSGHTLFHAWTDGYAQDFVQIRLQVDGSDSSKFNFLLQAPYETTNKFSSTDVGYSKYSSRQRSKGVYYRVELIVLDYGFGLKVGQLDNAGNLVGTMENEIEWYNGSATINGQFHYFSFNNSVISATKQTPKYIDGISFGKFYSGGLGGLFYVDNINFRQQYVFPNVPANDALKLSDVYANGWIPRFIKTDGRVVRAFPEGNDQVGNNISDIVSEAIGYAEIFAVQFNDVTTFDLVENYTYAHLDRRNFGQSQGPNLMAWHAKENGTTIIDQNWATDADVDRGMALIWAAKRKAAGHTGWASSAINYDARARAILADLKTNNFKTWNGKAYFTTDSFQLGNPVEINPSYISVAAFKVYRDYTGDPFWDTAIAGAWDMFTRATSAPLDTGTGTLPPEWNSFDNTNGNIGVRNGRETTFSYNAFRTYSRAYWYKLWFPADTAAATYLGGLPQTFTKATWNANQRINAELLHSGATSPSGNYEKAFMYFAHYWTVKITNDAVADSIFNAKLAGLYQQSPMGAFYRDNVAANGAPSYFGLAWLLFNHLMYTNTFQNF